MNLIFLIFIFIITGCEIKTASEQDHKIVGEQINMKNNLQEKLNGKWIVKDIIKYAYITTIDLKVAKDLKGSYFNINNEEFTSEPSKIREILMQEDQNTTPVLKKPYYVFTDITHMEESERAPSLNELGFDGEHIYNVEIYKDDRYQNQWSLGILLFDPAFPNRIVLSTNGVYFELEKSI